MVVLKMPPANIDLELATTFVNYFASLFGKDAFATKLHISSPLNRRE